jgi:hypothetical protein
MSLIIGAYFSVIFLVLLAGWWWVTSLMEVNGLLEGGARWTLFFSPLCLVVPLGLLGALGFGFLSAEVERTFQYSNLEDFRSDLSRLLSKKYTLHERTSSRLVYKFRIQRIVAEFGPNSARLVGPRTVINSLALPVSRQDRVAMISEKKEAQQISAPQAVYPIEEYIKKLGGGANHDPSLVIESVGILAVIGMPAIPALVNALEKGDEFTAEGAALALRRMGPQAKPAVPALEKGLNHRDAVVRGACAITLGTIEPDEMRSVAAVVSVLSINRESIRQGGITTLADMGAIAIPALIEATQSPDSVAREGSEMALQRITGENPASWDQWWSANRGRYADVADGWQKYKETGSTSRQEEQVLENDLLTRNYNLHVKPAGEYRQGEKVILTFSADLGPRHIYPGTEAVVEALFPSNDPRDYGRLWLSIPGSGNIVLEAAIVDSLQNGMGEVFQAVGRWVSCRKNNEGDGWFVGGTGLYVRARLTDGRTLEGRVNKASAGFTRQMKIGDTEISSSEIENLIWRQD